MELLDTNTKNVHSPLLIPLQLLFRDILSHFVQNYFLIEWKRKGK